MKHKFTVLGRRQGFNEARLGSCVLQVSNWFINARVRLWKPMVEEMYQQEAKDDSGNEQSSGSAHTPTPAAAATTSATTAITPPPPKRSENSGAVPETDPSFIAINRQCFTDNQANPSGAGAASSSAARPFPAMQEAEMQQPSGNNAENIGSTLIRFGASAGDVSLTLGLRHAGNLPEKSPFSVRDFGGC